MRRVLRGARLGARLSPPLSLLIGLMLTAACSCKEPPPPPIEIPTVADAQPETLDDAISLKAAPDGIRTARDLGDRQKAVRLQPDLADRWVELGRAWVRTARVAQREDLYQRVADATRRALAITPGHRQALHLDAIVHRVGHRFDEVARIARALVKGGPRDEAAWALLSDAAIALDDMAGAEIAIDRLLDIRPALPAFSRAAWLRWLHGDVDGAVEMWAEAARASGRQDPEPRAWVFSELGHLEWHRGRLDAAGRYYEQALAVLPDHAGALFGRGRIRLARGDAAGAVNDFAASGKARTSEQTSEWHAMALKSSGDIKGADAIDTRLAAAGDFDDARSISLYLSHRSLDPKRAVERAKADFAQRHDIYALDALGFALFRAGDLDDAYTHLRRATRLGTADPQLFAHRGLVELARGETAAARASLDRAWSLNPAAHPLLMAEVARARARLAATE